MNTRRIKGIASMALSTLLGGATPMLALSPDCETGIKGEVAPVDVSLIKNEVHINIGESNPASEPPGLDESAGKPGRTEYPGKPTGCHFDADDRYICP